MSKFAEAKTEEKFDELCGDEQEDIGAVFLSEHPEYLDDTDVPDWCAIFNSTKFKDWMGWK